LASINGVIAIHPVYLHERPKLPYKHVLTGRADAPPEDTLTTHKMCGVDKLHAEGLAGQGVKIGIIDTGFDYNHPQRTSLSPPAKPAPH
jgi:subtilisin family serine protease